MLGLQVVQFLGAVVEETVELPQLRRLHELLLPYPSLCNDSCLGLEGRKLRRFRSCSTSSWSMSLLCRWTSGFVQFLDKVVDMPVIVNDRVAVHSGGASNSVLRLFLWTFQLCNRFRRDSQVPSSHLKI